MARLEWLRPAAWGRTTGGPVSRRPRGCSVRTNGVRWVVEVSGFGGSARIALNGARSWVAMMRVISSGETVVRHRLTSGAPVTAAGRTMPWV